MKLTSTTIPWRRPRYTVSALMLLRRIARRYPLTLGVAIGTFCAHGTCDKPPPPVCLVVDGPATVVTGPSVDIRLPLRLLP